MWNFKGYLWNSTQSILLNTPPPRSITHLSLQHYIVVNLWYNYQMLYIKVPINPPLCETLVNIAAYRYTEKEATNVERLFHRRQISAIVNCQWYLPPTHINIGLTSGPIYWHGLALIPAWQSNYIHCVGWNNLFIPKRQWACDYLSMQGFELIHDQWAKC